MTEEIQDLRTIDELIYLIRGQKVMLDRNLAILYAVDTRTLVQAVKRNIERFPADFCFQLSDQEFSALRSQIVISNRGGRRVSPYAFTEQGVAMLSGVLRSPRSIMVNVEVMRTFVRLRRLLAENNNLEQRLRELEQRYDAQFRVVFDAIREIMKPACPPPKRQIGFGRDSGT